ncbi:FmdB family transcriptional regulator [Nocardioides albidus]|uniref:FmdB family transcriptional regulator n=1 Tax=Nocardioides albidus TaxID=1517589 RepID=A0A5C4VLW6_9ACTN|nr:FmdB family zinc ribbon protein [Nocardioides albidus]TNM36466.1 FmdB family transcriptional regulator [Nocardioides albidus]
MPTYQYLCTECGHAFEQVQKFSDDALTTCPECTGKLRKVFNSVGVVFKGSGFYKTDSKSDSKSSSPAAAASSPAASSGGDSSGSSSSATSTGSTGSSTSSTAAAPA